MHSFLSFSLRTEWKVLFLPPGTCLIVGIPPHSEDTHRRWLWLLLAVRVLSPSHSGFHRLQYGFDRLGTWLDYHYTCVIVHSDHQTCTKSLWNYRIALNFWGSKFFANSDFWTFRWNIFVNSLHVHTACRVSNFHWNIFANGWNSWKFSAIRYCHYYSYTSIFKSSLISHRVYDISIFIYHLPCLLPVNSQEHSSMQQTGYRPEPHLTILMAQVREDHTRTCGVKFGFSLHYKIYGTYRFCLPCSEAPHSFPSLAVWKVRGESLGARLDFCRCHQSTAF